MHNHQKEKHSQSNKVHQYKVAFGRTPLQRGWFNTFAHSAWATSVALAYDELFWSLKSSHINAPVEAGCVVLTMVRSISWVSGSWCVGSWSGDG